jgi:hypothetical protein
MAWDALSTSHRSLRIGWFVGFLVPFAVALVPVSSLLKSFGEEEGQRQARDLLAQLIGTWTGFLYFVHLLPSVLSVLVGAMRASLNAKRFSPESPVPGWIAAACAPVFVLLLLAVIVVLNQVGGNAMLVISFVLIAAAFLVFPMRAGQIAAPCARTEVEERVGATVRRYRALLLVGAGFGFVALFTMRFFGHPFVGFAEEAMIGPFALLRMLIEFTGKSLFIALMFTDLIVALLRYAWGAHQATQYAELGAALEGRFRELEVAGLAGIARAKPSPAAPPATT